jgi:hypothetical protein
MAAPADRDACAISPLVLPDPLLVAGDGRALPTDEMTLAADLYAALQSFFLAYPHLQRRPLVISGESYAEALQTTLFGGRRSPWQPLLSW